ncbi:MAG TPA: PEGA domain-containing protein [Methanoregula sp.]|nr:PEGA domain-containing protein [Methanoregula sp.]
MTITQKIIQPHILFGVLCLALFLILPVQAFTADSLTITIAKNGDATASFKYTLEGVIENAIPESLLQEQLVKGLATSSEPPEVLSFDKSGANLYLKKFAVISDVPTGTEYQTASMDFKKAQIALENSAVSSVITADFSPKVTTVTFPDGYSRQITDSSVLPSLRHTVIDPTKAQSAQATQAVQTINEPTSGAITVSSSPEHVRVYIDNTYAGESPETFSDIAPGEHAVMLESDGFVSVTKTVTVKAGETTTIFESLSYAETPTKKSGVPGMGVIIAILALAGVGMAVLRRK